MVHIQVVDFSKIARHSSTSALIQDPVQGHTWHSGVMFLWLPLIWDHSLACLSFLKTNILEVCRSVVSQKAPPFGFV